MKKTFIITFIIIAVLAIGLFLAISKGFFKGSRRQIQINKDNQSISTDASNSENNQVNNKKEINSDQNSLPIANEAKNENVAEEKTMNSPKIIDKLINWGYAKSSGRSIDTIIIHSSYNALGGDEYNTDKLVEEYKSYGVSPHYLINRAGNIYRLVEDKSIAYHAGASQAPDGRGNVNSFSIGIEMMNTKSDKYTSSQYNSLESLLAYLKGKYKIKYVLGHSDIAPGRKDDPWNFDWGKIK